MSIEKRSEFLREEGLSRTKAIIILKEEFPKYHETYYNDITSDFPSAGKTSSTPIKKEKPPQNVRIVGFDMPFGDMVIFMVKWVFATIPAAIIIVLVGLMLGVLLASLGIVF